MISFGVALLGLGFVLKSWEKKGLSSLILPTNKKIIAREWIYYLTFFTFGLFIMPLIIIIIRGGDFSMYGRFFEEIFDGREWPALWSMVIGPYITFLIVRPIIWSLKVLRAK